VNDAGNRGRRIATEHLGGHDGEVVKGECMMKGLLPARSNGSPPERRDWIGIVDDDPSIRKSLARLLRIEGFTVDAFETPMEFFAALTSGAPACLVLDVHLGSESGFDLHDRLTMTHPDVPVIFITGHDNVSSAELTRRSGPNGFARKPFDGDVMIDLIRRRTELLGKTA
jgi:FixJ family two-component response regulator